MKSLDPARRAWKSVRSRRRTQLVKRIDRRSSPTATRALPRVEVLEKRNLLAAGFGTFEPLGEIGSGGSIDSISVQPGDSQRVLVGGDILGIGLTTDGGQSWRSGYEGWENYSISDFTWDPNVPGRVWAGTLGGPHVSDDAGDTWRAVRTGMPAPANGTFTAPIEKILIDPNDSDRVLAFEGDHRELDPRLSIYAGTVWISDDGGASWDREVQVGTVGVNIVDAEYVTNNTILAAVKDDGIYKSFDDGETWQKSSNGLPNDAKVTSVAIDPNDVDTAWTTVEDVGVFKTTDGGSNWTSSSNGLPQGPGFGGDPLEAFSIVAVGAAGPNGPTLFVGNTSENSGAGIFRSLDGGANWEVVVDTRNDIDNGTIFAAGPNAFWVEVDPNDPNRIWAGDSVRVILSTDGGDSWEDQLNDTVDAGLGTYRSRGYTGWVARNLEYNPFQPNQIVAQGLDSAKLLISDDDGASWRRERDGLSTPYAGGQDIDFYSSDLAYAVFGQKSRLPAVARTYDGGQTWEELALPEEIANAPSGTRVEILDVHVSKYVGQENRVWILNKQGVFRTSNADQGNPAFVTWKKIDPVQFGGATPLSLEADPSDGDAFYVMTSGGVYRTSDGKVFEFLGGPTHQLANRTVGLSADPNNSNLLYVANESSGDDSQNGLWKYDASLPGTDPTTKWVALQDPTWDQAIRNTIHDVAVDPTNSQRIVVGTNKNPFGDTIEATGLWVSNDGGQTFEQSNSGLGMLRIRTVTFSPDGSEIIVGTGANGWFRAQAVTEQQIGETGSVTWGQNGSSAWYSQSFEQSYENPVVVVGPPSRNGGHQGNVRVRNVTSTGFEYQFDEWDYLDGFHTTETASWMVVEAGIHTLDDGRVIEAGTTVGTPSWQTQTLSAFTEAPVILTQVSTANDLVGTDTVAVTTQVYNVAANGSSFRYKLREQESNDQAHLDETVSYIALSQGVIAESGSHVANTGNAVTHQDFTIGFDDAVGGTPAFFANMQTTDGGDTAVIRYKSLNGNEATIFVEEEKSRDNEVGHTTEVVGWAALPFGAINSVVPSSASSQAAPQTQSILAIDDADGDEEDQIEVQDAAIGQLF